ncbi:MAG: hypothetical protein VKJ64_17080 [Leptolyngbyaceae bacterium]|nr:hypothetical protein [Leptolyngbyaceae bacterium]
MPVKSYDELLVKSLHDPVAATAYLTACSEESEAVFWQGLRMVIEAQGGVEVLAPKMQMDPEQLSFMLTDEDKPPLSTLMHLINALGFRLSFSVMDMDTDQVA